MNVIAAECNNNLFCHFVFSFTLLIINRLC